MKKTSRQIRDEFIWKLYSGLGLTLGQIQAVLEAGGQELTTVQIWRVINIKKGKYESQK